MGEMREFFTHTSDTILSGFSAVIIYKYSIQNAIAGSYTGQISYLDVDSLKIHTERHVTAGHVIPGRWG